MVKAEREFIDRRVEKVIALKKKLCDGTDKSFIVVNQKGIDPQSLDMLAANGISGLRRAKRRNMERITLACGGTAMNSFDDDLFSEDCLGYAGHIYEHVIGDAKFTFVEDAANAKSVTILIKVRQLPTRFWTISHAFLSTIPPNTLRDTHSTHCYACRMLTGARNPMFCPMHVFRAPTSTPCSRLRTPSMTASAR